MEASRDYCAFTKAVEHLGDRWSLLIVRELAMAGPLGFNALAARLPRISRSVLARRLRKLGDLGLLDRALTTDGDAALQPYQLAPAGRDLVPTLLSLRQWAEQWVPEDPAMAARDPGVIGAWLAHQLEPAAAPSGRTVLELEIRGPSRVHMWLVIGGEDSPSVCLADPELPPERYVYVEAGVESMASISRGTRDWDDAIRDGSVLVAGEPNLVRALPTWFRRASDRSAVAGRRERDGRSGGEQAGLAGAAAST